MTDNTINNDMTMGGASGTLLAGRYRVVRQLGQGGMGSVWLAEDTVLDNRQVAIKMLPSVLMSNKRAYKQIKSEALVSLKLSHPNIAPFRSFEDNGGNPFLVVDYIEGQSLDDYLAEKGTLSEDETIKLLKPIAEALDYAHGEGVIHRDVKPANIMIRKDGHPFILDFGIAREVQETMTMVTGKLSSGTLMYMSPEQVNGELPSSAQDVYSFAIVCYECLTGHPPFVRGSIEHQILNVEPARITGSSFADNVMQGLSKNRDVRPKWCNDFFAMQSVAAYEAVVASLQEEPITETTAVVAKEGNAESNDQPVEVSKYDRDVPCETLEDYVAFATNAYMHAMGVYKWNGNFECEMAIAILKVYVREIKSATLSRREEIRLRILDLVGKVERQMQD